jgi:hypothetical protein
VNAIYKPSFDGPVTDPMPTAVPHVYAAINAVQAGLNRVGIAKDRKNTSGATYNFRGIDDCYNAIAPLMAEHGLCMLPRMMQRDVQERLSKSGNTLIYTTVHAEFDFVATKDGSKHTVATFGEAMDSGDKSTNKAMSAAQKYAILQAFVVPTEGDNDTENHTHELAPVKESQFQTKEEKDLRNSKSLEDLQAKWLKLSAEQRKALTHVKDSIKKSLAQAAEIV